MRSLLTQVLAARAQARRAARIAIVVNLLVAGWAAASVTCAVADASPRRYVRAGTMLSTTLIDESTLARDLGHVIRTHAQAVNEELGPRWPELAQKTLDANASLDRATRGHVSKTLDKAFDQRKATLREQVQRELAEVEPAPALTNQRVDLLLAETKEQIRQTLQDAAAFHVERSRRALGALVRDLPTRASDRWTERWTNDAAIGLGEVGERFVRQHGGLEAADWSMEVER